MSIPQIYTGYVLQAALAGGLGGAQDSGEVSPPAPNCSSPYFDMAATTTTMMMMHDDA